VLEGRGDAERIVIDDRWSRMVEIAVSGIPATIGGAHRAKVWNAQFAAAIAYGLGIAGVAIVQGLSAFTSSFEQNPGRFNIVDQHPFRVVLDKATGAEAVSSMATAARGMAVSGRRFLLLMAPGKYTDEFIVGMGRAAGGAFDRYICAGSPDSRYREPQEIADLLARGLLEAGVDSNCVSAVVLNYEATIPDLLADARAGDLVVITTYPLDWALKQVMAFRPRESGPAAEVRVAVA
jgi:cyanophycin synthetase